MYVWHCSLNLTGLTSYNNGFTKINCWVIGNGVYFDTEVGGREVALETLALVSVGSMPTATSQDKTAN